MRIFIDSTRRKTVVLIDNKGVNIKEFAYFSDVPMYLYEYIKNNDGFSSIEVVGITIGPGSFTGIRNTIAFFKAWKIIKGIRVLGYNSLFSISRHYNNAQVIMPSRRGRVFIGQYGNNLQREIKISELSDFIDNEENLILTNPVEGISGRIDNYGIVKGMSEWYAEDGNYSLPLEPFYLHE